MYPQKDSQDSPLVFLYPGQDQMQIGLAQDIYNHSQAAKDVFDIDAGIRNICFDGPPEMLNNSHESQSAKFLALQAISAALHEVNIRPTALAGQSLGEYVALSYAGAFNVADAISILRQRARIMIDSIPSNSGMWAIFGLETAVVERYCVGASTPQEPCTIGTYGTPDRNVITGSESALNRCVEMCRREGARALPVKVSRAFHSPLAQTAKEKFAAVLENFSIQEPVLRVYYNQDGATECKSIGEMLADQLVRPVQLVKTINHMLSDGFRKFVRIGPGGFFGDAVYAIAHAQGLDVQIYCIEKYEDIEKLSTVLKKDIYE